VRDTDGNPVQGVTVTLAVLDQPLHSPTHTPILNSPSPAGKGPGVRYVGLAWHSPCTPS
jgi:hypothetical protein